MKKNITKTNKSEKINKKSAKIEIAAPKKRGRPRKNPIAKESTSVEKPLKKRIRKQMAHKPVIKKIVKKSANKKNLDKKTLAKKTSLKSNPNKELFSQAKKLFGEARKNVSALKKTTKLYGKLLTDVLKLGDEKTISRVQKLFGYAGYTTVAGTGVSNTISAKVKAPKAKMSHSDTSSESTAVDKTSKKKLLRKTNAQIQEPEHDVASKPELAKTVEQPTVKPVEDAFEQPQVSEDPSSIEEPTEEELAEIESELNDDEENPEDDDLDVFKNSDLRDRSESDNEIYDAMRENGDID